MSGVVPVDATVLVVSKGDDDLLDLGRRAWHFPQGEDGGYAGYHPADAEVCIAEMERLRARGADFLLLPSTVLWWLEYYAAFGDHLRTRYEPLVREEDTCALFDLRPDRAKREGSAMSGDDREQQRRD